MPNTCHNYLDYLGEIPMPVAPLLAADGRLASASPNGSPETSYTLSSSASPASGQQLVMESDLGESTGGLVSVAQSRLRDSSAASGGSQSNSSLPALVDGRRERSPRRDPIENTDSSSYRPQRSRARERSPMLREGSYSGRDRHRPTARDEGSRDVSETRTVMDFEY